MEPGKPYVKPEWKSSGPSAAQRDERPLGRGYAASHTIHGHAPER